MINKRAIEGFERESLLAKIFSDSGYSVTREVKSKVAFKHFIFDMVIEKGDEKYVVEIKGGAFGIENFRNMLVHENPYSEYIEKGYKVLLICEKDKVDKRLINDLEKMNITVWDYTKIIQVQKELYSLPKNCV